MEIYLSDSLISGLFGDWGYIGRIYIFWHSAVIFVLYIFTDFLQFFIALAGSFVVMYFALITIGITSSVNIKFAIGLTLLLVLIIFSSRILDVLFKKYNKNIYSFSFSEGQLYNNLEVVLSEKKDDLGNSKILSQVIHDEENNVYIYKFCSPDRKQIVNKIEYISNKYKKDIKNITADYI